MNVLAECNKDGRIFIYWLMNTMALPATRFDGPDATSLPGQPVVVDLARNKIHLRDGRRYELSAREADLLTCLACKVGTPVSRSELLAKVWKIDPRRTVTRTIDMHISVLRKKLGDLARTPAVLVTVYGVGYMLRECAIAIEGSLDLARERGLRCNAEAPALVRS